MSFAGFLITMVARRAAARFEKASHRPMEQQTRKLMEIVTRNADTDFGRRFNFAAIRTVKDYQRQVPLITYEDMQKDIERMAAGEPNVLTAERPVMFAQTSGTTGDPKLIPVTPSCQGRDHTDIMRTWLYTARRDHAAIFDGKMVALVSPAVEGYTEAGIPYGSTSGHIYRELPGVIRRLYAVPYCVFEIPDYTAKYYTIMRLSLEQNVSMLCTANPSTILKMCEKADELSEEIICDIRNGSLSQKMDIPVAIRRQLEPGLRKNKAQAESLTHWRSKRSGTLIPADYWPRLSLIGCWKGGTVGHYVKRLTPWFDPDGRRKIPVRDWGYLASEMRGSLPLADEGSHGALTVATNFYEFADVEDVEAKPDDPGSWAYKTVSDLVDGGIYHVFVTTTGGLYRYDINDVVQVTGYHNQTPQIAFLRKGSGMTNITGEKLSVNQVISACQAASQVTGVVLDRFKVEVDADKSRYLLRVEFADRPDEERQRTFLREFDQSLKEINIEYKAKRESLRLSPPVLHVMREGWHERERKRVVQGGHRMFQAKEEILSPVKQRTDMIRPELDHVIELT
ncbi:MAG: GH3 auxin-responsive promoter family protein [Pseudomonadota bacterium]